MRLYDYVKPGFPTVEHRPSTGIGKAPTPSDHSHPLDHVGRVYWILYSHTMDRVARAVDHRVEFDYPQEHAAMPRFRGQESAVHQ